MTEPRRLWSGDWHAESAAAKARVAARRTQSPVLADDPTEPIGAPTAAPPRRPFAAIGAGVRRLAAHARALSARRPNVVPRGLRGRLVLIAVLAAAAGAATTIGVEAATGNGTGNGAPWLGVSLADAPGEPGALVESVIPGSPASAAGVEAGDLITSIGSTSITSGASARTAIEALRPGTHVTIELDRSGQQVTVTATLGTRPANAP